MAQICALLSSVRAPVRGGGGPVSPSWRWQIDFVAVEAEGARRETLPDAGFQRSLAPPTIGETVGKPHRLGGPRQGVDSLTRKHCKRCHMGSGSVALESELFVT